jgi:Ca2+-binding RTX toxin-like protein
MIVGTHRDDIIFGGDGHDRISGGGGDDRLFGQDGNDVIFGEDGNDFLSGEAGNDTLSGGTGDDVIAGGEGADTIAGGGGNDLIVDGAGEDIADGGEGDDCIVATATAEDDAYAGGAGCDTIDYSAATEGLTLDLVSGSASSLEIGTDTISGFEIVRGGSGDDQFIIGREAMVLAGGAGENRFEFASGDPASPSHSVVHEILDFKVGDLIRMSKYDIFEEVLAEMGDQLEEIYGRTVRSDAAAIRYRHEKTDEIDRTLIEADLDRDAVFETTIEVQGRHALIIVEHA